MSSQALSRRSSKYTARTVPKGEKLSTSAMIASLDSEGRETISAPFGHALVDLAKDREDIVGLTADWPAKDLRPSPPPMPCLHRAVHMTSS